MKNKLFTIGKKYLCFALVTLLLSGLFGGAAGARGKTVTAGELETLIDGISAWKTAQTGTHTVQDLIEKGLAPSAGTGSAEWYIIALRQYKSAPDFSAYTAALNRYAAGMSGGNATDRQRIALAFAAVGGNPGFIQATLNTTIGKLGVMSDIYGLLLLDAGGYESTVTDRNAVILNILSLELPDGGWALSGSGSDVDVTAMALQALAPYRSFADVKAAVDRALTLLSQYQQPAGDYKSWGTANAESTAQVIAALSALGIDCQTDARFIKNGRTPLDGLLLYKRADGGFSHLSGGSADDTASVQALYSLVAAWRQAKGLRPLYQFTSTTIPRITAPASTAAPTHPGTTAKTTAPAATRSLSTGSGTAATGTDGTSVRAETTVVPNGGTVQTSTAAVSPDSDSAAPPAYGYKPWACGVVAALGLLALGVLFFRKKLRLKNVLTVGALTAGLLLAVLLTNIQTVSQYYAAHPAAVPSGSPAVTMSVRCDTALGKGRNLSLPKDGCMLPPTRVALQTGDTVFDALERAARSRQIPIDYKGAKSGGAATVYVKGIGNLYEFDCGSTSGWMYRVNGRFQTVGCADCPLSDGDVVEWIYTCDLGKDVGNGVGG